MQSPRNLARATTVATVTVAAFALLVATAGGAQAATDPGLGTADSFVVLAGGGVTNTGTTTLSGNLGAANGSVVGDTDLVFASGVDHYGDGVTTGAMLDLEAAFGAASQPVDVTVSADLGGQGLVPGVYFQASTMNLSGPALTLDAGGNPDAIWIFRAGSDLIVGPGASVNLVNGAQACNVYWQVASSASLDSGADLVGTVMARTAITLNAGATVQGRVLALDASISLITNTITAPACTSPASTTGTGGAQVAAVPSGSVATGDGSTSGTGADHSYLLLGVLTIVAIGATTAAIFQYRAGLITRDASASCVPAQECGSASWSNGPRGVYVWTTGSNTQSES
jgi:hypothetical protein